MAATFFILFPTPASRPGSHLIWEPSMLSAGLNFTTVPERTETCIIMQTLREFEIWGSNNPNADGSWASWDSIGTFESFKPSGLPLGQVSAEDIQFARVDGEDFDFPWEQAPTGI